jgi:hypothetical protein
VGPFQGQRTYLRSIVQDGIDASELLEDHDPAANRQTLEHVGSEESLPRSQGTASTDLLGLGLLVEENGGFDFEVLGNDERIIVSAAAQLGERVDAVVVAMLDHEPSWAELCGCNGAGSVTGIQRVTQHATGVSKNAN